MNVGNVIAGLPSAPNQRVPRCRLYLSLFVAQTVGAGILFWEGIPLYRKVLADPASHSSQFGTLIWSLLAVVLIQVGYWVSYHYLAPPRPHFTNALLGNLILFSARMSFVFATSVFGIVFIAQRPGFQIPGFRYLLTLVGLFSLYCYVQELERWGRALMGARENKKDVARVIHSKTSKGSKDHEEACKQSGADYRRRPGNRKIDCAGDGARRCAHCDLRH